MGVDLIAIMGHGMPVKELLELPTRIDTWTDIVDLKQVENIRAEWNTGNVLTEDELETIIGDWENNTSRSNDKIFDNAIDTFFGQVDVWRNTLFISHSPEHKYSNLCDPTTARMILSVNRAIAKRLNQSRILYTVDSAFPTSCLCEYAQRGKTVEELIVLAEQTFGKPPHPLAEAMKYMYFVDDFSDDLSHLAEWSPQDQTYWRYNGNLRQYELKNVL